MSNKCSSPLSHLSIPHPECLCDNWAGLNSGPLCLLSQHPKYSKKGAELVVWPRTHLVSRSTLPALDRTSLFLDQDIEQELGDPAICHHATPV